MSSKLNSAMEAYRVRDFAASDYPAVAALWTDTGMGGAERGDDHVTIERSVSIGGRLLLLVNKDSDEIVGTSWMTFDGRRIHLHHFAIAPYYQGRGLSHILLRESLKHVVKKGCQVKLEVHSSNLKAIGLYRKAGFRYLGDYDVYIVRDIESLQNYILAGE